MKNNNKLVDYLFTIAASLFFLGIIITSILLINDAKTYEGTIVNDTIFRINVLHALPFIICIVLSVSLVIAYTCIKSNYFKLIKLHVKPSHIHFHYYSLFILLISYILGILMMAFAPLISPKNIINFYFYLLIAFSGLFNLIGIGMDAYSKIMIKIDLMIRREKGKDDNIDANKSI